jgi:DNA-binding SARP family transcriptional activator/ABC-type branched-subunit amino acid transport system substrate-binding protein
VEFRLLGPLEVADGEDIVRLGEGRQRSVLVLLLLHRNEAVSSDRLIDALWGERPPPTAAKVLQNHVGQLRRALGDRDAARLQTRGHAYLLRVGPGELDLDRFEQLVRAGGSALGRDEPAEATARLGEALALWRGPPLADVAYESFAQPAIARLEERRLAALEQRIDADLALGRHAEVIAELEALIAEHPLREHLRGQLMLALYRMGRQGEALRAYQDARNALVDELGVEPGPALRDLQAAILRQDPELAPIQRLWPRLRRRSRRTRALLAGGGAVVLAAAAAAALLTGGGGPQGLLPDGTVASVDPATGRVLDTIAVPGAPSRLAVGAGELWVGADGSRTVTAVDARRGLVVRVAAPNASPTALVLGAGALWVADRGSGSVVEIDPSYGTAVARIRLPSAARFSPVSDRAAFDPWSIAAGAGAVWVTDGSRRLFMIDADRRVARAVDLGHALAGVAANDDQVWAISGEAALALRVDPRTGRVRDRIAIVSRPGFRSPYPIALGIGAGSVWVLNGNTATLTRIDPAQRGVSATIPLGVQHGPLRLAVARGAVYVANGDGTLIRIDARTNAATVIPLAHRLLDVGVAGGRVWVTASGGAGPAPAAPAVPAGGRVRPMSPAACSPVYARPGQPPRLLIASDLPLQGEQAPTTGQMVAAMQLVLGDRGFRAGRFAVGFQSCDETPVPFTEPRFIAKCSANARAYARNRSVIGVIGPLNTTCAENQVAILNRAPGGPLAIVNASSTSVGLTHRGTGVAPDEPGRYYPTGQRNFARVIAADDVQAAANALVARRLGVRRLFVLNEPTSYGAVLAAGMTRSARALGIALAGAAPWGGGDPQRSRYTRLARRIARARADAVFLSGGVFAGGGQLIRDLARVLGARVQLLAPDGFYVPQLAELAGVGAEGMTVSVAGQPLAALPPRGKRFVARLRRALGQEPDVYAVYAAQAADILLDAIARSDGTRASVSRQLLRTRVRDGILGDFAITPSGDTTAGAVTILRVQRGKLRPFAVITPPARLVAGG